MTKILQKANKNVKKLQKYDKTYINEYLQKKIANVFLYMKIIVTGLHFSKFII